ncbi:DUF4238 domain-containing protein [Paraburkholderia aspalathi]|nr:DUF4238 domain-containing protein [Paraburkholderia aspalathi]
MAFEKKNHHYVPQFWQRGFRAADNTLYGRFGARVAPVSSRKIMQQDWAYTIFDQYWTPSDDLENALSVQEGYAAPVFERLCTPGAFATKIEREGLCSFLALQSCRHPDVMGRGHRRGRELGEFFANVHAYGTAADFAVELADFGLGSSEADAIYQVLKAVAPQQLRIELNELLSLSPQDPQLPQQEALLAQPQIATAIDAMTLTLLDAPAGEQFVLGDTPMPQSDLSHGFIVPLSKSVALKAVPSSSSQASIGRRTATVAEVTEANREQWNCAMYVVIGADKAVLQAL